MKLFSILPIDRPCRSTIISRPITVFFVIAVSLIFFLPAAISMNGTASAFPEAYCGPKSLPGRFNCQAPAAGNAGTAAAAPGQILTAGFHDTLSALGQGMHPVQNKKSGLSLRTAAMIGFSAAEAAAVLVRGSENRSAVSRE